MSSLDRLALALFPGIRMVLTSVLWMAVAYFFVAGSLAVRDGSTTLAGAALLIGGVCGIASWVTLLFGITDIRQGLRRLEDEALDATLEPFDAEETEEPISEEEGAGAYPPVPADK